MTGVRRILLVGDAHGDLGFLERSCQYAVASGCDVLVQLGDLGVFWPGATEFVSRLDQVITRSGLRRFAFVDGNHEGWDTLVERRRSARRLEDGFVRASRRVEWIDRGTRWTWNGVRFGALGGAFSVDSHQRSAGRNWWPSIEEPDDADVARLCDGGPLDVLLTHDTLPQVPLTGMRIPEAARTASRATRQRISDAVSACRPTLLVHGHWHQRYGYSVAIAEAGGTPWTLRVEGLGANIGPFHRAIAVLDLASSAATMPAGPPLRA